VIVVIRGVRARPLRLRSEQALPRQSTGRRRYKGTRGLSQVAGERSTVFAIKQVAHGAAPGGGYFDLGAAFYVVGGGVHLSLARFFRFAARGAAIGEAGLIWAEFELLVTDDAAFDREGHA
jgi:hypothetical protein